ncbi:MAG: hypothetical protein AABX54_05395 [Nanoarchaeota archaeon]
MVKRWVVSSISKDIEDSKFVKNKIFLIFLALFFIILIILVGSAFVSAEELSLKITGTINNITSDIYLKTNSNAATATDAYDMYASDLPSGNYSLFYSNVSNNRLSIDSWNWLTDRIMNLIFQISAVQTGTLSFSWAPVTGSYAATFTDYGSDSSYTTAVGSANMRSSSSYSSTITNSNINYIRVSVSSYTASTETPVTSGGGGGGGGGAAMQASNITVSPSVLEVPLVVNTVKISKITVANLGNKEVNVFITSQGLDDIVQIGENSFKLKAGESKEVEIKLIGPDKPGIYTGKILVNGKEIFVSVNVNTKELLFDAGISILDEFKKINVGSKLNAQVTLIPMGDNPRVDVTLNYIIKDFEGRTFFTESETILVDSQKTFKKEFATQNIPAGNYVLGLELTYPNGVATSTSHFEIVEMEKSALGNYFYIILISLTIVILVVVVLTFFVRRTKKITDSKIKKKTSEKIKWV